MLRKFLKEIGFALSGFNAGGWAALLFAALAVFAFIDLGKMNVFNASNFWGIVGTALFWVIVIVILSILLEIVSKKLSKELIKFGDRIPKQKPATLKLSLTIISDEIYIKVQNGEWWLDAKDVSAIMRKKEQWININDDRCLKWKDSMSQKVTIKRRKHEFLHFASINQKNNKYHVHTAYEDKMFSQYTSAAFYLYVTGNMKSKSVNLRKIIVVQNNQGKLDIELNDVQEENKVTKLA